MSEDTAWMRQAVCATRLDLPWIADPDNRTPAERQEMRAICVACPVLTSCIEYVRRADLTAAWWAGLDFDPDAYAQLTLDLDTHDDTRTGDAP